MVRMFREVIFKEDGSIGIPCYESDEYRWLTWLEQENMEEVFKRHSKDSRCEPWTSFKIWPEGEGSGDYSDTEVTVYEMVCSQTQQLYYLLVSPEMCEFDSIFHSVALPYNGLNLILFFNKYLMPLAGKPYINGD